MSDHCSSNTCSPSRSTRHICPANGKEYLEVETRTVLHHLESPWRYNPQDCKHFFCDDPDCDVVYFTDTDSTICRDQVRTAVGQKETGDGRMICYCFGVTVDKVKHDPTIKAFVVAETKGKDCACEVRNPSGRCCLGDFPRKN